MKTIASFFEKEPGTWGLRGDPHLWREMQDYFTEASIPATENELTALIEAAFESLTGHSINESDTFYVERFAHGGMSSGYISPEFWREKVMPMICERFDAFPR